MKKVRKIFSLQEASAIREERTFLDTERVLFWADLDRGFNELLQLLQRIVTAAVLEAILSVKFLE